MPITEEQRKARRGALGSSDIPAIFGVDRFKTPHDVWASKVYELENVDTGATSWGTALEDPILDWTERELGVALSRNRTIAVPGAPIVANIDAVVSPSDPEIPVEAKSCAIMSEFAAEKEEFGEPYTDQVPDRVCVQANVHMLATGADHCWVPTLIGGRGPVMFDVPRAQSLIDAIAEQARRFWDTYVTPRIPPDDEWATAGLPSLETIKRIRREPSSVVVFNAAQAALVDAWESAKDALRYVEGQKKQAEAAMLIHLGEAEGATLPDGRMLTYLEQHRKEFTVKATTFRVARIKKAKVKK